MTNKTIARTAAMLLAFLALASCRQESMQDKAERDAKEYTRRYCPTPVINYTRTDSVAFDRAKNLYTYYCTLCGAMDDEEIIEANRDKIAEMLRKTVTESTSMKPFIEAGFRFQYVCRSEKDSSKILFQATY